MPKQTPSNSTKRITTPQKRLSRHRAKLEPRTVLLIHDGRDVQAAIAKTITRAGHICITASTYDKATRILAEGRTEIVICDCSIHGVSPNEFIYSQVRPKNIPFTLISGRASQFNADWGPVEWKNLFQQAL